MNPRVDFKIIEFNINDKKVVIFKIDAAYNQPIAFKNMAFIRVGSYKKKLRDFPAKERKIWNRSFALLSISSLGSISSNNKKSKIFQRKRTSYLHNRIYTKEETRILNLRTYK